MVINSLSCSSPLFSCASPLAILFISTLFLNHLHFISSSSSLYILVFCTRCPPLLVHPVHPVIPLSRYPVHPVIQIISPQFPLCPPVSSPPDFPLQNLEQSVLRPRFQRFPNPYSILFFPSPRIFVFGHIFLSRFLQ